MRFQATRDRSPAPAAPQVPLASHGWGTALRVFDKILLLWCGLEGGRFRVRVRVGQAVRSLGR